MVDIKKRKFKASVEANPRYEFQALLAIHQGGWERESAKFLKRLGREASASLIKMQRFHADDIAVAHEDYSL